MFQSLNGMKPKMDKKQNTYTLAMSFLNKPYIWGGKNPVFGMDCSGLVCELLQSLGMLKSNDEHNAQSLCAFFMKDAKESILPSFGSLIFYGKELQSITHVGFGLNDLQMIEAGGGTAATVNTDIAEKTNAYVKIRPFNHRSDCVVILDPNYHWE